MKKLKYSIAFKAAAAVLSFITVCSFFAGMLCTVAMFEYSFYARSKRSVKADIMGYMLEDEAYRIAVNYIDFNNIKMTDDFEDRFSDSNLYYSVSIRNTETGESCLIAESLNEADAFCTTTVSYFQQYYDEAEETLSEAYSYEKSDYIPLRDSSLGVVIGDGNSESVYAENNGEAVVTLAVKKSLPTVDKYSFVSGLIDTGYSMRYGIFIIIGISAIASVALWIYLLCAAGRASDGGELKTAWFDKFPFDLLIVALCPVVFVILDITLNIFFESVLTVIILFCAAAVLYFSALICLLLFAAQVKKHCFIKGLLCYRVLHGIYKLLKPILKRIVFVAQGLNLVFKTAICCAAVVILELILIYSFSYETDMLIIWCLLGNAVIVGVILLIAVCLARLKRGGEAIAGGNLEYKIDTENMLGDFKRFGESLNHISDGMQAAVDEKMKSERMKTELITNVSHDIKTPLTSIINYVDLIKKEHTDNPVVDEYITVLDKQSKRLKKLIEDLVEASKASSGVLKVELSRCNVGILLSQAAGEYEEHLAAARLTPVLSVPDEPIYIMADGRYLWRVFDNLMNNICKYSQPDTRIYTDLFSAGGKAGIIFKNVSKFPLNITGDELMERFVRGDTSRSTEGSGLGLSIAQSLTELQGGKIKIIVDGDLFKVVLSFPISEEQGEENQCMNTQEVK